METSGHITQQLYLILDIPMMANMQSPHHKITNLWFGI